MFRFKRKVGRWINPLGNTTHEALSSSVSETPQEVKPIQENIWWRPDMYTYVNFSDLDQNWFIAKLKVSNTTTWCILNYRRSRHNWRTQQTQLKEQLRDFPGSWKVWYYSMICPFNDLYLFCLHSVVKASWCTKCFFVKDLIK